MSLPVQLHTIPVISSTEFFNERKSVLTDFRHLHVPREFHPLSRLIAQQPLWMFDTRTRERAVVEIPQALDLGTMEVIVIHPH